MEHYSMIAALFILIILIVYNLRLDTQKREQLFRTQLEMATAQQAMTKELPWSELKKILDEIMNFTCSNYITINGLRGMADDRISLLWTAILNDVSTTVELSMSEELKRQILKNVSLMYLTKYIKDSVQLLIVLDLEQNRENRVNQKLEYFQTGKKPNIDQNNSPSTRITRMSNMFNVK